MWDHEGSSRDHRDAEGLGGGIEAHKAEHSKLTAL